MIAAYLSTITRWVMTNHIYQFDGHFYLQQKGAPIGLQISVMIAKIIMMIWDREMIKKMVSENLRAELHLRYVDDVNLILRIAKNYLADLPGPLDKKVATKVCTIADSIIPGMLQFEADFPSNHRDGKLPILDLACWVKDEKVITTFYKKEVSSSNVVTPNSGFTPKVIRNIITQEAVRRLINCSPELDWEEKVKHLTRFNLDLMRGGHREGFRRSITESAIGILSKRLAKGKLYRSKEEIINARISKPDKSNWFKTDGSAAVINIPATIDQELVTSINSKIAKLSPPNECKVRVQQSYGVPVINNIMTYNLMKLDHCNRKDCFSCEYIPSKGNCYKQSVNYQIDCRRPPCSDHLNKDPFQAPDPDTDSPLALYRGETSRSCYRRGLSHQTNYLSKNRETRSKSCLWRHTLECHDGVYGDNGGKEDFGMRFLSQEARPLDRQTQEGFNIQQLEDLQHSGQIVCLNSKQDFQQSCRVTLDYRNRELNS